MTLSEIIAELPGLNLRLCNLFQLDKGWQANVSDAGSHVGYEFGRAETPEEALLAALKAAGVNVE